VDQVAEARLILAAGPRQPDLEVEHDAARTGREHDDPVGETHGLTDAVGDQDGRGGGSSGGGRRRLDVQM
jgi:hypothetical protein